MIPSTVTIAGWNGDEAGPGGPSMPEYRRRLWDQLNTDHPGINERCDADDETAKRIVVDAGLDHMHGFFIAHAHRNAAPLANEFNTVTTQAIRAVQQAESDYADLSKNTTVNWLAAHHRFVLSTQHARDLLERRVEIATDLLQRKQFLGGDDLSRRIYARYVPAAEHRIAMPDLDQVKTQLANFVEESTERFAATRVTVTGGYPEGFEPAPIDGEPFERPTGEEIFWESVPYDATPAVVAGERRW